MLVLCDLAHKICSITSLAASPGRTRRRETMPPARRNVFIHSVHSTQSELFAMGPVQFSQPRGVTENWFTKPGFWENFVCFPRKNSKTQSSLNFL